MSDQQPYILSVRLMTYKHEDFIIEAMESIDEQVTNFDFEIWVGDDFSPDRTSELIDSFVSKNPRAHWNIIHREKGDAYYIKRQKNGRVQNFYDILSRCSGKYVALLDGDDYWTDPHKLQKQLDLLESSKGVIGCFHNSVVVNAKSEITYSPYYEGTDGERFNQFDCLTKLRSAYSTGSLVYLNDAMKPHYDEFLKIGTDFILEIMITNHGDLIFMDQNMSAYRFHEGGIWQGNTDKKNKLEVINRYLFLYENEPYRSRYNNILWNKIVEGYDGLLLYARDDESRIDIKRRINNFLRYSEMRTYGYLLKRLSRSLYYRRKKLMKVLSNN